jgi:hypothetical protein
MGSSVKDPVALTKLWRSCCRPTAPLMKKIAARSTTMKAKATGIPEASIIVKDPTRIAKNAHHSMMSLLFYINLKTRP